MSAEKTKLKPGGSLVICEIGQDWLKVMRTRPVRGGVVVSAMHLEPLEASVGCTSSAVAAAWKKLKVGQETVVTCLPRQAANVRIVELPSTEPSEIADMVELQAGKHTPYTRDEVVLDYRVLGPGREGYTQVMLVIVQRALVRHRYHVMEEAGVDIQCMTVSSEGLFHWGLTAGFGVGTVALLDVDSYYTDLLVMSGGRLMFSRSLLIGANQLFGENAKWKEKFGQEVQRSLEACRAEQQGLKVEKLILSGAGPRVAGLANDLQAQIGIPVESQSSVLAGVKLPSVPVLEDPAYRAISLTSLFGVGLKPEAVEFNLIPDSVRMRRNLLSKAKSLTGLGILVMTLLLASSFFAALRWSFLWSLRNDLKGRIEAAAPEVGRIEKMQGVIKAVRNRKNMESAPLAMLAELRRVTPEDVLLDVVDMDEAENRILLEGTGENRQSIRNLVQGVEQSPRFIGAKEEGASSQEPKSGRYRFRIVCALEGKE